MIISSGLDQVFPKGMKIGRILKVTKIHSQLFQDITLETSVDFNKIEEVLVFKKNRWIVLKRVNNECSFFHRPHFIFHRYPNDYPSFVFLVWSVFWPADYRGPFFKLYFISLFNGFGHHYYRMRDGQYFRCSVLLSYFFVCVDVYYCANSQTIIFSKKHYFYFYHQYCFHTHSAWVFIVFSFCPSRYRLHLGI